MTLPAASRMLDGIRVIDPTWISVGPGSTRLLASMGVNVIYIEPAAPARVDTACDVPPFIQDNP